MLDDHRLRWCSVKTRCEALVQETHVFTSKTFALGVLVKVATRFRSWARSPYQFLVLNGIVCSKGASRSRPWSSNRKVEGMVQVM